MAIWAIAKIVRGMSGQDVDDGSTRSGVDPNITNAQLLDDAPLSGMGPTETQRVDEESNLKTPNVASWPTGSKTNHYDIDHSQTDDGHQFRETTFEFQEVTHQQPVATIERPPATETLEIELAEKLFS